MQHKQAFIVGSPRSGTTLMGWILDEHPEIAHWYEPVFVVDKFFKNAPDDVRAVEDATPKVKNYIRQEFAYFQQHTHKPLIIDKNPLNSFKIEFLHEIFPDAKFIHMLRDGRDSTRSIQVEWTRRLAALTKNTQLPDALRIFWDAVNRQSLLKHKIQFITFEIGHPSNLLKGKLQATHRGRRWRNRLGYGPRFAGWEDVIDNLLPLAFNAMQWRECVEAVLHSQPKIPAENFLEVRYENLLQNTEAVLTEIFDFLDVGHPPDFLDKVPQIQRDNTAKWRSAFSDEDLALIGSVLQPTLFKLGYVDDDDWYPPD